MLDLEVYGFGTRLSFLKLFIGSAPVLQFIIYLPRVLCLSVCVYVCVCHNCGTLCYSFSFGNQTDHGDETEGLEREGLKMER